MIVLVFLENVVLSLMVDRHYPYLRKYKKAQVDDVTKKAADQRYQGTDDA